MPRKNSNKLLADRSPNPDYKRSGGKSGMALSRKKFLSDGAPNPAYKRSSVSGGKHRPAFLTGQFVGIDGEGAEVNGVHQYTYLAYNDGSIFNERGLTTVQCLDFLLDMGYKNQKGIFCIFAGGYDMNLWIRDIPKEIILLIVEADGQYFISWDGYAIKFVQRRFFEIKRDVPRLLENGKKEKPVKIWDVWGFFQGSFISAVQNWIPAYDKLDLIVQGKALRVNFQDSDHEFMIRYNAAELEALVMLMEKLRESMIAMGLTLRGWHGAGAVASAIYKLHDVKSHLEKPPAAVHEASKHAYFGGRIEIGQYGTHNGTIHHYDVNSSYPAKQRNLPSLAGGQWIQRGAGFDTRTSNNICIALVKWGGMDYNIFNPFPLRSAEHRKVLFPAQGYNWIYKPELDAALKWRDMGNEEWVIDIEECYEFIPATDVKPFDFINEYYKVRQELVAESKRTKIPNGKEKGIKLGLNSLYGKTAQRIGYDKRTGRIPPYHNLVYAGYITSASRAELFDAAMQAPDKIICMATDGIYSTVPLDLDCPKEKVLGKWEYQTHDSMILVQSGFYFLRDGEKLATYSRGFDRMKNKKEAEETLAMIQKAWNNNEYTVYLPCTRFVTLKSALCGDEWWARWCTWYKFRTLDKSTNVVYEGRKLTIDPTGSKRIPEKTKVRADKTMIQTTPALNLFPDSLSQQHGIPWDVDINTTEPTDYIIAHEHDEELV